MSVAGLKSYKVKHYRLVEALAGHRLRCRDRVASEVALLRPNWTHDVCPPLPAVKREASVRAGRAEEKQHAGLALGACGRPAVGPLPQALWFMLVGWIASRRARTWWRLRRVTRAGGVRVTRGREILR